jgi:hypothetical protein
MRLTPRAIALVAALCLASPASAHLTPEFWAMLCDGEALMKSIVRQCNARYPQQAEGASSALATWLKRHGAPAAKAKQLCAEAKGPDADYLRGEIAAHRAELESMSSSRWADMCHDLSKQLLSNDWKQLYDELLRDGK